MPLGRLASLAVGLASAAVLAARLAAAGHPGWGAAVAAVGVGLLVLALPDALGADRAGDGPHGRPPVLPLLPSSGEDPAGDRPEPGGGTGRGAPGAFRAPHPPEPSRRPAARRQPSRRRRASA